MKRFMRSLGGAITSFLIIGLGLGAAWYMNVGSSGLPLEQHFSRNHTNAVWDWSNVLNKDTTRLQNISDFMYLHQINTVYVDADRYAELSATTASAARNELDTAYARYITALEKRHIKVYAAAGDPMWSDRDKWQKPATVLANVERYNNAYPQARFSGMEYDIESYNQPGFDTSSQTAKSLVLGDYLDTLDYLTNLTSGYMQKVDSSFDLGFAIPYWYDNENGNIPSVTWNNQTGPVLFHLLDRLNKLPHSNVVVMAYRNAASGNDGIITHSRTEVDYASVKAPRVKVIIGQEVNDVQPAKITYYGKSSTELSSQYKIVEDEFKTSDSFGGIAINDLSGYMQLK